MVEVKAFFDKATFTLTYVIWDLKTRDSAVIDPVLDYDPASSKISRTALAPVFAFLKGSSLSPSAILETHAHADHVSGAPQLKEAFPKAVTAIGKRITEVQRTFAEIFDLGDDFPIDGRQFDRLLKDGETWPVGSLSIKALSTPGHTPTCSSYLIDGNVFTGDALFMPDSGVGRCDFPAGSAETLYHSVTKKLYSLPEQTKTFTGHDYQPNGREVKWQATIREQKQSNIHLNANTTKEDFIRFRTERDKTLSAPRLLLPSIQMNIDGGRLPTKRKNGRRYLSIPVFEA